MAPGQDGGKNKIYSQVSVTVSERMCSFCHSGVLRVSEICNTWKASPDTSLYLSQEGRWWGWRKEPHENEQGTWGLHAPGCPLPCCGGAEPLGGLTPPLCAHSGPHRGAGPDGQDDGELAAQRLQDQEGHVPHGGAAVQGAAGEADDHAAEHHAQLRALHHPQPREEGEAAARLLGTSSGSAGKGEAGWATGAGGKPDLPP